MAEVKKKVRRRRKPMSAKQKEAAAKRLAEAREKKQKANPPAYSNVHEAVRKLPDDHPLSRKAVMAWIKTNKDLLSGLRAEVRQKAKGAEARLNSISGYIRNMEKYLRDGDWVDNFYGADQEKKIRWRCVAMAYYPDGTPKRDVGTYYDDIMEVYTKEMAMADGVLSGPSKTDKPKRKRRSKKNK
jgi:hypothetical protein